MSELRLPHPGVFEFEGLVPVIDPSAYVHPTAVLIGDVIVGARCYVAPGAVLRGDFGRIELRADANLQDNCVVHSLPDFDCVMDEFSHIGHGAVIHGCWIGRNVLIGMNAVILDRARVGDDTIVGAMALLKAGGELPARVLATGVPARVVRDLSQAEIDGKRRGTDQYVELARRSAVALRPAAARTSVEPDRPRLVWR